MIGANKHNNDNIIITSRSIILKLLFHSGELFVCSAIYIVSDI